MTAVTLTESQTFVPGFEAGTCTIANAYTSKFGFGTLKGVVLTTSSDNDAIVGCAVSSGSGTVSAIDDAGAAINTAFTANYIACGLK